jgi:hypothetical protein
MNWYVAEAVFESVVEAAAPDYIPLVERSWFLISASDQETAEEKAFPSPPQGRNPIRTSMERR